MNADSPASFQSRNRDAFRFKLSSSLSSCKITWFQSRNRDAFRFKCFSFSKEKQLLQFQSRNRDAFRFKPQDGKWILTEDFIVSISESRCFSFQGTRRSDGKPGLQSSFNLGIEMLFVSSSVAWHDPRGSGRQVSISESRCFSFQAAKTPPPAHGTESFNIGIEMLFVSRCSKYERWRRSIVVSISESRCFSFQHRCYRGAWVSHL